MSRPRDLYAKARRIGNIWYGVFRTPGRRVRFVMKGDDRQKFDNRADALQAAADVLCEIMRDNTRGFFRERVGDAQKAAEALFKPKGKK